MREVAPEQLSEREREVAEQYVEGRSYKEIARTLGISPATVRTHINGVYRKLEVTSRIELLHRLGSAPRPMSAPFLLPDKPSLAVLPFANMSGDPEQEYFSNGISEDLTTDLSKISGLFVLARNSIFALKGEAIDVHELGSRLGVRYVVEGSVRKSGQRVRITAQLVDTATSGHLWAERYDRELTDIFAVQDEITAKIIGSLKVALLPTERRVLASHTIHSIEAYELVLRGRHLLRTDGTKRAQERARSLFVAATNLDDQLAEAFAGIAESDCYLHAYHGVEAKPETVLANCDKALALDPTLAAACASRGQAHALAARLEQAEHDLLSAIERDPDLYQGHMYYARLCFLTGRVKKAAWHYLRAGELRSDDPHSVMLATMCHRDLGEVTQMESGARACAARARAELAHRPDNATAAFQCAIAHAMLGERAPALAMVERALSLGGDDLIVQYNVACVQSLLGDLEGAMDRLEVLMPQASQHRKEWLRRDRDLAPLHGEPRFIALLRTYGVALPSETT